MLITSKCKDESEARWARDLWAPENQGELLTKRRVFALARDGYAEIAKPLEPFVFVFVIFGVPAIVMATDYCQSGSTSRTSGTYSGINDGVNFQNAYVTDVLFK